MAERTTELLRRALRMIEARRPASHAAIAAALDGITLVVEVEDRIALRSDAAGLREIAADVRGDVRITTDRRAIVELVGGRTTLLGALRSGALDVAGRVPQLRMAWNAFEHFVSALIRIDESGALMSSLERKGSNDVRAQD